MMAALVGRVKLPRSLPDLHYALLEGCEDSLLFQSSERVCRWSGELCVDCIRSLAGVDWTFRLDHKVRRDGNLGLHLGELKTDLG